MIRVLYFLLGVAVGGVIALAIALYYVTQTLMVDWYFVPSVWA